MAVYPLKKAIQKEFQNLKGRILDVGCGDKPYVAFLPVTVEDYIGLDIQGGEKVDIVVQSGQLWPFENESFDGIVSNQVLEHVEDLQLVFSEIDRVLKPGGILIFSFPFLYNEHGTPYDFRRFTRFGAMHLFPDYHLEKIYLLGGIGSTIGILFLNWIENTLNRRRVARLSKGMLLPLWLTFSVFVNITALLIDRMDSTENFYHDILVVLRKR